jgi:hypothetical protein
MSDITFHSVLIKTLNTCDFIPAVSFLTNFSIILAKKILNSIKTPQPLHPEKHSYSYVKEKPHCALLLIPGVNIIVALYDKLERNKQEMAIQARCKELDSTIEDIDDAKNKYSEFLTTGQTRMMCKWKASPTQQSDQYWSMLLGLLTFEDSYTPTKLSERIKKNLKVIQKENEISVQKNQLIQMRYDSYKQTISKLDKSSFLEEAKHRWLYSFNEDDRAAQSSIIQAAGETQLPPLLFKRYVELSKKPACGVELKALLAAWPKDGNESSKARYR